MKNKIVTLVMITSIHSFNLFSQNVDTTVQNNGRMTVGNGTGTLMQFAGSQEGTDTTGQAQGGFGIVTGTSQIAPMVWMYGSKDKNAFKIISKGYGKTVQNSPSVFEVGANGVVKIGSGNNQNGNSPGLVFQSKKNFLYDGEYINHYGVGSHQYKDNASTVLGANVYMSGYYGLDLFTGGKNRLRINKNGNVGIGTVTPNAKLEVGVKHAINQKEAMRIGSYWQNNFLGLGFQYSLSAVGAPFKNIVNYENGQEYKSFTLTRGHVGVGTDTYFSNYKLSVAGKVQATEIKVHTGWADYVFAKDYKLPTLTEVAQHIEEKGHLINIPSAKEVAKNGILLGEMNARLLEKIEELTLYTLEQEEQLIAQKKQLELQKTKNERLEERLTILERLLLAK